MANSSILPKLVCPESRQPLAMADGALVARLNEAAQKGLTDSELERLLSDEG